MTRVDSSTAPAGCLEKGYHLVAEFISPPKVYTFSFIVGTL